MQIFSPHPVCMHECKFNAHANISKVCGKKLHFAIKRCPSVEIYETYCLQAELNVTPCNWSLACFIL